MDIDDDGVHSSVPSTTNALAGPSTIHAPIPDVFLLPAFPTPQTHLKSTQDLLARFQLLPAYDKHVRPYVTPLQNGQNHIPQPPPPPGPSDKSKGKEREKDPPPDTSPVAHTPGMDGADADEDDGAGHGEKKKRNNYKHLIKGVPGKHSMKKDDYLTTIIQVPPKQRIPIVPFDAKTQLEAFTVSLDGLKGWNPNALILESAQAREDRKKRKELKKLAKAQSLLPSISSALPPPGAALARMPTPTASQPPPTRTVTPKPGIPRPGSRPVVQASVAAGMTRMPASGTTPLAAGPEKRGKKRDYQDVVGAGVGTDVEMNGEVGINGIGKTTVNAKAGVAGVRPRPIKKQRMDIQGQARDVTAPVQQPTPQGV